MDPDEAGIGAQARVPPSDTVDDMRALVEVEPTPIPGGPRVGVLARSLVLARPLMDRLLELGLDVVFVDGCVWDPGLDGVLIVSEDFEARPRWLGTLPSWWVARGPEGERGAEPVIPAWMPGALAAWVETKTSEVLSGLARRAAAARAEAFVELSADSVVVLEGGRVVATNAAYRQLFNQELPPFELPSPGDSKVISYDGQPLAVEARGLVVPGAALTAITLRSAAGDQGFQARLAHTDRLVAVGALAAGFAHEVNNPAQSMTADLTELGEQLRSVERGIVHLAKLVPIERRSELAQIELDGPISTCRSILQDTFDGLSRIAGIVRDLKSFSRLQPERIDWVHPNEIVNQSCAIANNHIRQRARLVKDLGACDAVPGDRNKLIQVLTNLLVNAAEALKEQSGDQRVVVRTRMRADKIVISVIDTGPGIPPEALGRIFEPFFTTKGHSDGTGLGLAMSLDIARQHAGTLEVETSPTGTRFDLLLPLDNGLIPARRDTHEAPDEIQQTGKVALVDDEPGILRSLGRLIGRHHEVLTFCGGGAALEGLAAADDVDVVICDLMMPDLDGPALYEALCSANPRLARRMVFMSGGAFTRRTQDFLADVCPPVLDKPAPAAELQRAIQRVMAERIEDTVELSSVCSPTRNLEPQISEEGPT